MLPGGELMIQTSNGSSECLQQDVDAVRTGARVM